MKICQGCPSSGYCAEAPATRCGFGRPASPSPEPEKVATGLQSSPIPMVLYCPACAFQHIDAPKACTADMCDDGCCQPGACEGWANPPHRSHLCAACGYIWRPADVETTGVATITTQGKDDSPNLSKWLATEAGRANVAIETIAPPDVKRAGHG